MKAAIYVSGVVSFLLLLGGLLGLLAEYPQSSDLLLAGAIVLTFLFYPLMMILRYRRNKRIDKIIEDYKGHGGYRHEYQSPGDVPKGWSMNDSPFRQRKSGLTWGGGTISHSKAARGTRRRFLKKS